MWHRVVKDLILWDYNPTAIKLALYHQQLLIWCDSVDVIRVPTYIGKPVRYSSRKLDAINCEDSLENELFEFNEYMHHRVVRLLSRTC